MNVPVRPPQRRLLATGADLKNWLAVARPGDALEYHRGFLALDRSVGSRLGEDDRKELCRVADAVMTLARSGHVHLVQCRRGQCDFTYIAIAIHSIRCGPGCTSRPEAAS